MSSNVLLTLRDILAEETDANHPIQKAELMKKCRLHGVEINARTLTRHLEALREHYPSKVHCTELLYTRDGVESSRKTDWFWESDEFIEGEVRLLEDIVSQLPLIAPRDRRDLLSRLGSVLNNYGSEVPEDIATFRKAQNKQFLYNVEVISAAIAERHVIEYELGHYDENGNVGSYGKEAKRKRICPYFFCSANNNYYLLGKYENTGKLYPLCVGMMFNVIEATDENGNRESFSWEPPRDFNLTRYVQQHVHMQNDEPCRARIRLHTKDDDQQSMMLHQIFRQFGTDAKVPSGQLPNAPMEVSIFSSERGLKFWALQFADLVEVVEPESLRRAVKESARKILNRKLPPYGKKDLGKNTFREFLKQESWSYDFEEHDEPTKGDWENSYLALACFWHLYPGARNSSDIPVAQGMYLKIDKREYHPDVMNNPSDRFGIYNCLKESGANDTRKELDRIKEIYHTIGNFALLPWWSKFEGEKYKCGRGNTECENLQFIHNWLGEWWDLNLQYILNSYFNSFSFGEDDYREARNEYIRANCLYMYFPEFHNDLRDVQQLDALSDDEWIKRVERWDNDEEFKGFWRNDRPPRVGDLCSPCASTETSAEMRELEPKSGKRLDSICNSEQDCWDLYYSLIAIKDSRYSLKATPGDPSSAFEPKEMALRIQRCIEARGRCIMALLRQAVERKSR